jgi:hypothetical protein
MENIAKRNGLTLYEFENILSQRGELEQFKRKLKETLLKEKLFNEIVKNRISISPQELKNYYENHKDEFSVFRTIQVVKYTSNNPQILSKVKQNPLEVKGINVENKVFFYNELPVGLMFLFKNTPVGEFTPVVNEGINYAIYYIARKDGTVILPFEKVKNTIANKLANLKREEVLKEYFVKLKNRAKIEIY